MVRSLELARQGELLRGAGEGLRRVPELTEAMRLALAAIEIAGCRPLSEQRFRFPGDNGEYEVSAVVLQRLIRKGLIEVMRRVPELTEAMRLALAAIEIAGCRPLSEQRFRFPGDNGEYEVSAVVLQRLIRKGLIEVMGLGPAVYRVTKLGRLARSMR